MRDELFQVGKKSRERDRKDLKDQRDQNVEEERWRGELKLESFFFSSFSICDKGHHRYYHGGLCDEYL